MDKEQQESIMNIIKGFQEKKESGLCPFCSKDMSTAIFRDKLSEKEHKISGLCQTCQDSVFDRKTEVEIEPDFFEGGW